MEAVLKIPVLAEQEAARQAWVVADHHQEHNVPQHGLFALYVDYLYYTHPTPIRAWLYEIGLFGVVDLQPSWGAQKDNILFHSQPGCQEQVLARSIEPYTLKILAEILRHDNTASTLCQPWRAIFVKMIMKTLTTYNHRATMQATASAVDKSSIGICNSLYAYTLGKADR